MPVNPTFPGVYIQELPSGVRTITGVATSITAFLGRAVRGPTDQATPVTSFADFERTFGGLAVNYPMSYAVQDFYVNGGSQAIIVRIVDKATAKTAFLNLPAEVGSPPGSPPDVTVLTLDAASPGSWPNDNLSAAVDHNTKDPTDPHLFNLTVFLTLPDGGVTTEKFLNVSTDDHDKGYIGRVLKQSSALVRVRKKDHPTDPNDIWLVPDFSPHDTPTPNPKASPPITLPTAAGGDDGLGLSDTDFLGSQAEKTGLFALEQADLFNLLCIPADTRGGDVPDGIYPAALSYCVSRRAMLLVDPPSAWSGNGGQALVSNPLTALDALNLNGTDARNAAVYFPRIEKPDLLRNGQINTFVPCGMIAGVMARTDTQRGVWKAPAGLDAGLTGTQALEVNLTDNENGLLNPLGINCLRSFPVFGRVAWGARTLRGADAFGDDYKYVPVRRLALFIEESLYRGTQWVVFEPNDEPLWAQIRLNVGAFMQNLFRQGAFQGQSPKDAYFVKCDKETTTQNDINLGIVNIVVGFAPLKPAEFVIISLQQMAGQIAV
ncbi:MAG: phage tail sheath subtilisin-like domain-containing protein [Ktedonobacteraceae bacterium]